MAKQVIILRKDLGLRKGQMIAYGAHASWKVFLDRPTRHLTERVLRVPLRNHSEYDWLANKFTKVCVSVGSEAELVALYEKALVLCIHEALVAAAIGPDHEAAINQITGELPLL